MNIQSLFRTIPAALIACCAISACGTPYSPGTLANANNVMGGGGGTMSSGPSVLSTQSAVVATVQGAAINLPYVIYAPQTQSSDPNKIYGIEFLDYDPCTWGQEHGWTTWPTTTFNQLGFYFPSAPAANAYNLGGGSGDINPSLGALGTKFTATQTTGNNGPTYTCTASSWLGLASGSVTVSAADMKAGTVNGTLNITLSDGSTITGSFQSGSCSLSSTGGVSSPDTANACTAEH